ncbi:MAG: DUF2971 domain-containing protein [Clostridia bacterium]|nr:DUF2971 domain-containing protein [Clostridia bacterium]
MIWRDEYSRAIWGLDINKAKRIKNQSLADLGYSLYRYRSFNENNLKAIENEKMWMSYPKDFNDPFEFSFKLKSNIVDSAVKIVNIPGFADEIAEICNRKNENFRQQTLQRFTLCCFMEDNKSKLMWSHYADGHKGFCIEYDFSESEFYDFVYPVCYRNSVYTVENSDNRNCYLPVIITKSADWSYENEWRVLFSSRKFGLQKAPRIRAIYLGVKTSDEDCQKMVEICKKKTIDLYHMRIKPCTYEIFAEKITF